MMRRIELLFGAGLLLTACVSAPNPFKLPTDIQSAFNDAAESAFLGMHPQRAARTDKILTLIFLDGRKEILRDKGEEECENPPPTDRSIAACYIFHRVIGYSPERDTFLLDLLYYEGDAGLLLHGDGTRTDVAGRPTFSPNGTLFAAYGNDCTQYSTSIEIWQWNGGLPVLRFDDPLGICIDRVEWRSNSRLDVHMNNGDVADEDKKFWSETITLSAAGQWTWVENDDRRRIQNRIESD